MSYLTKEELNSIGFMSVGDNVCISDKVSIYGSERIKIGNNVRIDDYCVLSAGEGGIEIQDYIHIAIYTSLIGGGKITICNYANLSSRVSIYSSNDDYSGAYMSNPVIPGKYTNIHKGPVFIGQHVIIGCGSIVLPDVNINQGAVIGALSLVKKDCKEFTIYAGTPALKIKERSKMLLDIECILKNEHTGKQ